MSSVKGMTWGTPEFIAIAKAAEREGEMTHAIGEIQTLTDRIIDINSGVIGSDHARSIRYIRDDLSEIIGEYACYGECQ